VDEARRRGAVVHSVSDRRHCGGRRFDPRMFHSQKRIPDRFQWLPL